MGSAPDFLKIAVSTMPGCIVAANTLGFSTGRNSITLICASLDAKYEDRLGKFWAGSAAMPVTKLSTVACEGSAKGLNALTARNVPLTFVCWETRAQQDSRTGRDARDDGSTAAEPFRVATLPQSFATNRPCLLQPGAPEQQSSRRPAPICPTCQLLLPPC